MKLNSTYETNMITSLFHSLIKKPVLIPFNGTDIPLSVNLSSCVFRFSVIFAGTGYLTMLRKIPLLLFAIILLGSCSDKDLEPLQEEYNRNRERPINTASRLPLMLKADAKEGNIYDMFMFEIADRFGEGITMEWEPSGLTAMLP